MHIDKFFQWQNSNHNLLSLWLNHLVVVYAFLLPLDHPRAGAMVLWIIGIIALVRGNYRYHFSGAVKHPAVIAFLLFYFLHFIWNLRFDDPWILVYTLKENVEYGLFLPLFLGILDSRFTLRIVSAFLVSIMFSELVSYGMHFNLFPAEWVFHNVYLPWHSSAREIVMYSQGSFYVEDPAPFIKHSVYTAALAFSVAVMAYRLLNDNVKTVYKIIMIFFMLTMSYNISIVGGRAGYFIYIVLLAIAVFMTYKKKSFLPLVLLTAAVAVIAWSAYSVSPMFKQRIDYTIQNAMAMHKTPTDFSSSEGGRIGMWYYASDVIKENLWFGVPEENFVKVVHARIPMPERTNYERWYFMPHSFYLSTLLEFGLVGFILLLNLFYQPLRFRHPNGEFNAIRILAVVMVAMSLLSTDPIDYFFFPFLVMMAGATMTDREYLVESKEITWKTILGYTGAVLVIFGAAVLQ